MLSDHERQAFTEAARRAHTDAAKGTDASTKITFTSGFLAVIVNSIFEAGTTALRLAKAHADELAAAHERRADRNSEHLARIETRLQKLERSK